MQQDQTLEDTGNVAKMLDWRNALSENSAIRRLAMVPIKTKCIYVAKNANTEYPDFFEEPILLIAKKFKSIIGMYQKNVALQPVVLIDKKAKRQTVYYQILAPEIDCASSESPLDHIGAIEELVLDKTKVGNQRMFHVTGFYHHLIVRLDLVESILRRSSYGITFQKLRTEQGGL